MPVVITVGNTYTPQDAIDVARARVQGVPIADLDAQTADIVQSEIWLSYPWWWTLLPLTPITLLDGVQDYWNTVPSDFQTFKSIRNVQTNLTPMEYRELTYTELLSPELTRRGGLESIRRISKDPVNNGFRLEFPPVITSPTAMQLEGEYQMRPTRITDALLLTPYANPDQYFMAHVEGITYHFFSLTRDLRAGTVQITRDGRKTYTGQLGIYYDAIQKMIMAEDNSDGTEFMWPEVALGNKQQGSGWYTGW